MIGLFSKLSQQLRLNTVMLTVSASAFGLMFAGIHFGLVFNDTHSAPFGLYSEIPESERTHRDPRPYIFFCPDVRWHSMKGQPNYRSPMRTCPDGFAPLIKPVVAWPGDTVEASQWGIAVNGVLIENTIPLAHDSEGHAIHPYPYGTYSVQQNQLWAVSSFSPRSFDSRYFGPVPVRSVHLWVRPLLVEKTYRHETH